MPTRFPIGPKSLCRAAGGLTLCLALTGSAIAQVFVVGRDDRKFNLPEFHPSNVPLPEKHITERGRQEIIRALEAEIGFARRPLPGGDHGVILRANGALEPGDSGYSKALAEKGMASGAGDRVIISKLQIHGDRIVLELNGGPDPRHKYLQHISISAGGGYTPLAMEDEQPPMGSRVTLLFSHFVPELTNEQVHELLSPLIDFEVKSPEKAWAETLPPLLRTAIEQHRLLVGMNRRMVIASRGAPAGKVREADRDGVPYEEWIYGQPPADVELVRFVGDRVVRIETAPYGRPVAIRTEDETGGYLPVGTVTVVREGDPAPSNNQAAPTLRKAGEPQLPNDSESQKVQLPGDKPADAPTQPSTPATPASTQQNFSPVS